MAEKTTVEIALTLLTDGLKKGFKDGIVAAKDFSDKMEKQRATFKSVAKASGIAFGAISAGIAATIIPAKRLEDGIINALTLIDVQGDEFEAMKDQMSKDAIALSRELGVSAAEISESFYNVLSTGAEVGTEGFKQLTTTAIKMAKVTGLTTAQAVETLAKTVGAFNLELEDAGRIADIFFNASKKVTVTVPELAESFKEAGPAAAQFGFEIEETVAVLDAFAESGITGAAAGTTFKIMATRLGAATGEAADTLERLGVEAFNADGTMRDLIPILTDLQTGMEGLSEEQQNVALKTIAGEEAFTKLGLLLSQDLGKLTDWKEEFKATGGTSEAFEKKLGSLTGQMDLLKTNLEAIIIPLGQQFIPLLVTAAQKIVGVIDKMAPFIEENKKFLAILLGVGAGGAGLLFGLSSMAFMLSGLPALLAAVSGPVGLVVLGIIALAGAVAFFLNKGEKIPTTLEGIDEAMATNAEKVAELKKKIDDLDTSQGALVDTMDGIPGSARQAGAESATLAAELSKLEEQGIKLTKAQTDLLDIERKTNEAKALAATIAQTTAANLENENAKLEQQRLLKEQLAEQEKLDTELRLAQIAFETEFLDNIVPRQIEGAEAVADALAGIDDSRKLIDSGLKQSATTWDELFVAIGESIAHNIGGTFLATFDTVLEHEKNFLKALSKAFGAALLNILINTVNMFTAQLIAEQVKEEGKALIRSILDPTNLAKIALIAAAGAAATSAMRGVANKNYKPVGLSFQEGGVVPFTGQHLVHQGEIVFNPQKQSLGDLNEMLGGAGVGGGPIFLSPAFYGPIDANIDINRLSQEMAEDIRRQLGGNV